MASNPYAHFAKPNPYAVYSTPGAGPKPSAGFAVAGSKIAPQTFIPGSENDPAVIARRTSASAQAEQAARIAAERKIIGMHDSTPMAQAELAKAQADAIVARQKADEAKAEDAINTMAPNSNIHGDAYLKQFVPPAMQAVVKAYARGDLGSRSGGLSTSMLPIIQHAMNYDPSASGTNFPARVKMQSDLASGDPKSAGGSLQAFERMLLHGSEVLDAGGKLKNFSSGVPALLNYPKAAAESVFQDPDLAHFNAMVRNYAPEAQKAISGVAGGEGERQSRAGSFSGSISPQALAGGLQADAKQAYDAMQATNDRYKRLMGHDIVDALSPAAKAAYNKIMSGGYDPKTGKALMPADGFTPIGGADGGGTNDAAGGSGGGSGGGAPTVSLATGNTRVVPSAEGSAIINAGIRSGLSDDQIDAALHSIDVPPIDRSASAAARAYFAKNPSYKGSFGAATKVENQNLLNRFASSPVGVGMGSAADAVTGGLSDEIGALPHVFSGDYGDTVARLNAKKNEAFSEDSTASTIGNMIGSTADLVGGGMALKGTAAALRLGRLAPYVGASVYGGITGAGQDNDNRISGAALGAVTAPAGVVAGQVAAIPLGAMARSAPALAATNGVRRMFGRAGIDAVPSLSPAASDIVGAANKAGPDAIRASLNQASDLGVPMSLADTAPQMTALAGQAVRRSPTASGIAEGAFLPRARGQIDRFGAAVNRDLGPIANIPQTSENLMAQAKTAAAPLYDAAYSAPGASSVKLDDLMSRPSMQAGLARARGIALEEGRDPTALGFNLDQQGNVTVGRTPSFQTLDYVKRGLDDTLEPHRNLVTGKLNLNEATRAINATKNELLSRIDKVNPDYAAARKAYAGPAQNRDALAMGQDSLTLSPDELAMQSANMTPDQLSQMQLGQRSALMARANSVRDTSNPWEATLGNTTARARIDVLHPNNPGTDNLFAQRDMEGQIARSANDILGNSKSAQRIIADQAFAGPNMGDMAGVAVDLAHGGVPVGTIAKAGLTRGGMAFAGKRAVAKADALAPMMFNTDPVAAKGTLDDLLAQAMARSKYVQQMRPTTLMGYLGAGQGASMGQGY